MKKNVHKACRRYGVKLCQSDKCPVLRRNYPPGVHGNKGFKRLTNYGKQLAEKQKAKYIYGLRERQFRVYFDKAFKKIGKTGEILFAMLENRLDNTVFRLGLAKSRRQARQIVGHGHIEVNGQKVDIPSYQVKVGDVIAIRARDLKKPFFENLAVELEKKELVSWLSLDKKELKGKVTGAPNFSDLMLNIDWQSIVEFYSK